MSGQNGFSLSSLGLGRNSLDAPVALLAALAVAFAVFAIPADQLAALVGSSGLPEILPAAEPPLGNKARIGVGAAGALFVFALIFSLLRLLDSKPARAVVERVEAPRVRRRDFHPDAPAPRPISALLDLGEPAEASPVPAWLSPADLSGEAEAEPETLELDEPEALELDEAEALELDEAEALELDEAQVEPAPVEATVPVERSTTIDWNALRQIDSGSPPATAEPAGSQNESIAELMARLERGLARRPVARPVAPPVERPGLDSAPSASPGDDRLQSAIDSLQRFASRQA
jgi:hypothetical protein